MALLGRRKDIIKVESWRNMAPFDARSYGPHALIPCVRGVNYFIAATPICFFPSGKGTASFKLSEQSNHS